jgi:dTDP-4-dehydrorhamnose reductase
MPGAGGVLIVGHGLIGGAVGALLTARGVPVASVGRRQRTELPGYHALDLDRADGRDALRSVIAKLRPACVLLVHGPSDVTWIDAHETAARAVHQGVAELAAGTGAPVILVSTDNVFPGAHGRYQPADPVQPANGYGRVKALAENAVLDGAPGLVVRVSLVYGWADAGLRATFAQRCLESAADGCPLLVPEDQSFTPIHVRDVATVLTALCQHPEGQLTGIRHLSGPDELSRYEFARLAYELAGADASLVRACLREETEWACRPRFSSLALGTFADVPGLAAWRPMTPAEGLRDMLTARSTVPSAEEWDT